MNSKLFIAIIAAGIILRAVNLTRYDFWFDEAFTYHIAKLPLNQLISAVATDNNPPLYYLIIHFVLEIGSSPEFLRLPSFIANILVIFYLFFGFRKIIGKNASLIAASLFATSPLAIYMAHEARLHSLAILIGLVMMGTFIGLIRQKKTYQIPIFIIVSLLGLYTQYYLALLLFAFTVVVLSQKTELAKKQWFLVVFVILAAFAPWLFFSLQTTQNTCSCPNSFLSLPASLVSPSIAGVGEITIRSFNKLPLATLILFTTASAVTLFFALKGLLKNYILAVIYLLPLLTLTFFGFFFPVFSPKAFAIFSPLYLILVAVGIDSQKTKKGIALLLSFLLISISIVQITNPFFIPTKQKSIFEIVKSDTIPVAHTSVFTYYSLSFYTHDSQNNILLSTNPLSRNTVKLIGGQKQTLDESIQNLWFVDQPKWVDPAEYRKITSEIFQKFQIKKTYQVDETQIYYLKRME